MALISPAKKNSLDKLWTVNLIKGCRLLLLQIFFLVSIKKTYRSVPLRFLPASLFTSTKKEDGQGEEEGEREGEG